MASKLLDTDTILSENEEWLKLEEEWGNPVDLDTEEVTTSKLVPVFSTLDLRKTTFDSSFLFKKVRRKVGRRLSQKSIGLDYKDFLADLQQEAVKDAPDKKFYFINGQIFSAGSVEEICNKIDDIFKSVEKLCSATSTVRGRKKKDAPRKIPEVVQCSISTTDLSFDDTVSEKEKSDSDDIDRYIDEAFEQFNSTMMNLSNADDLDDESRKETVTTLVKKFSSVLKSPGVVCSPRKKRQCCDRFKELADFWKFRAFEGCD